MKWPSVGTLHKKGKVIMINLTIDGKAVSVPEGTTVLESSQEYATTVLDAIKDSEFVVEREIVNRGDE